MSDLEIRTFDELVMPGWVPGQEMPSDGEIVLGYWRAQAAHWAQAHHDLLRDYDALTLRLCHAFGDDWQAKVEKAIERKART